VVEYLSKSGTTLLLSCCEARGDGVDLIQVLRFTLTFGSTKACQEHQGHDFSVSE
jgi:hypothetical protein